MIRSIHLALAIAFATAVPASAETTIRAVWEGDLRIVDPHSNIYITRNFANHVYDALIVRNLQNEFKPQMLESWDVSSDSLTYTFKLRSGLKFHDGSPVRAQDSVASIRRWAAKNWAGGLLMKHVSSIDIVDDSTFAIKLSDAFPHVIRMLSAGVFVVPERLASGDPAKPLTEVMGSGPFKMNMADWVPGSRLRLTKNEDYVPRQDAPDGLAGAKIANIDGFDIVTMVDPETRFNSVTQGEVDYIQSLSIDYLPLVEQDPNLVVDDNEGRLAKLGVILTNQSQPPFNDLRVRKAFQYAIDSAEIMTALGLPEKYQLPNCRSIFICGSTAPYESNAGAEDIIKPNIEKAKALLAEAGYKGEPIVGLHTTSIRNFDLASTVVEQQLRRVGFNVQPEAMEFPTLVSRASSKEPVSNGGWSYLVMHSDAVDLRDPLMNSYVNRNCTDYMSGFFCNQKVSELREKLLSASTDEEIRGISVELQKEYAESAVMIIWGQYIDPAIQNKKLTGISPAGMPVFWGMKVAE